MSVQLEYTDPSSSIFILSTELGVLKSTYKAIEGVKRVIVGSLQNLLLQPESTDNSFLQVVFDSNITSFEKMINLFWIIISSLSDDCGSSIILYSTEQQRLISESSAWRENQKRISQGVSLKHTVMIEPAPWQNEKQSNSMSNDQNQLKSDNKSTSRTDRVSTNVMLGYGKVNGRENNDRTVVKTNPSNNQAAHFPSSSRPRTMNTRPALQFGQAPPRKLRIKMKKEDSMMTIKAKAALLKQLPAADNEMNDELENESSNLVGSLDVIKEDKEEENFEYSILLMRQSQSADGNAISRRKKVPIPEPPTYLTVEDVASRPKSSSFNNTRLALLCNPKSDFIKSLPSVTYNSNITSFNRSQNEFPVDNEALNATDHALMRLRLHNKDLALDTDAKPEVVVGNTQPRPKPPTTRATHFPSSRSKSIQMSRNRSAKAAVLFDSIPVSLDPCLIPRVVKPPTVGPPGYGAGSLPLEFSKR